MAVLYDQMTVLYDEMTVLLTALEHVLISEGVCAVYPSSRADLADMAYYNPGANPTQKIIVD